MFEILLFHKVLNCSLLGLSPINGHKIRLSGMRFYLDVKLQYVRRCDIPQGTCLKPMVVSLFINDKINCLFDMRFYTAIKLHLDRRRPIPQGTYLRPTVVNIFINDHKICLFGIKLYIDVKLPYLWYLFEVYGCHYLYQWSQNSSFKNVVWYCH